MAYVRYLAALIWLPMGLLMAACATERGAAETPRAAQPAPAAMASAPGPDRPVLVGKRCKDGYCTCRVPSDPEENPAPPVGEKRLEIRISADGGQLTLESPMVGRFQHAGGEEACFYVDVPVSKIYDFRLEARESERGHGVAPVVRISEYGPRGPFWYAIVDVTCMAGERRCDPELARAWGDGWVAKRKRGRLDPCGSIVVTGLRWDTSGGEAAMNGGLLRDFRSQFSLEVKKFATEFPPDAAQCQFKQ